MEDSVDVSDFYFHTCRKFRIFPSSSKFKNASRKTRLACSSQFGVTFAVVPENKIICFPTNAVVNYKLTKENMNVEVTDLKAKKLNLPSIDVINDIGVNSDGSLLAILHTTGNNVFVEIYEIRSICSTLENKTAPEFCKVRIGTDPSNRGSALEWNPAFPDTFAATSSDHSIVVVKIDIAYPGRQSIIGSAKLGSEGTCISWSPKGKQLTIGDKCGKVVQLKPEIAIVRSVLAPDSVPNCRGVTGLCWLATTEWLVSYGKDENGLEHDTYVMTCKKDKPTEWVLLNELSYSNAKSSLPAQLLTSTSVLVDWNVILVANTRTSQIVPVGKLKNDWQTWTVDEGKEVYLPTTSTRSDTFPIGIALDRSMNQDVLLGFDGTAKKHSAAPVLLVLTDDGVLTAHHVININPARPNCQVKYIPIAINGLKDLENVAKTKEVAPAPAPAFMTTPVKPVETVSEKKTQPTVFPSPTLKTPVSSPKPDNIPNIMTEKPKIEEVKEDREEIELMERTNELIEYISKINELMKSAKEEHVKLTFGTQTVKKSVVECAEVVKESMKDSKEVLDELKVLVESIEEVSERTIHSVKEMDYELDEKKSAIEELEDPVMMLEVLRSNSEADKVEKFNKLEKSADALTEKFVQCNELMKQLQNALNEKETVLKQAVLSPLRTNSEQNRYGSGLEMDVTLKVMRNVTRIIMDTREKLQRNELELATIKKQMKNGENLKKDPSHPTNPSNPISTFQCPQLKTTDHNSEKKLTKEEILKARDSIFAKIKARGLQKVQKVKIESYKPAETTPKKSIDIDTNNLSNAIMKLSMTPRRVMTTSSLLSTGNAMDTVKSPKKDATTQADEPPVVQTVVVTVASDEGKKNVAEPIVAKTNNLNFFPKSEASTTTTSTTSTSVQSSPIVASEVPKAAPVPSPFATGASIFKTPTPTTPISVVEPPKTVDKTKSSSLFGMLGNTSSTEKTTPKGSIFGTISKSVVEEPKNVVALKNNEKKEEKVVEEVKEKTESAKTEKKIENAVKEEPEPSLIPLPPLEPPKTEPAAVSQPMVSEVQKPPIVSETPKIEEIVEPAKPVEPALFSFTNPSTTSTTPKPAAAASSSIFGGGSGASSSIFGGGLKTGGATSSPFGSFGQTTAPANTQSGPVSFSFNSPKPASTTTGGFGSFGAATAPKPSGFAAAAAAAAASAAQDDGMEDDSQSAAPSASSPFGGGFMSGLGSSGSSSNSGAASSNIFGNKPAGATGSGSNANSWLFGGGQGQNQNQAQNQNQKTSTFSFANAAAQHAQQAAAPTSSGFGAAPKFGQQPAFGAKPAFGGGAAPGGGVLSKNSSIFGAAAGGAGAATGGGATGFAQFATSGGSSSIFGGGTTQGTSAGASSSIFGGSSKPAGKPENSIFGGGAKNSSFGSWR